MASFTTMHCNNCGMRATPGDRYCDFCGAPLRKREVLDRTVNCSPYVHHKDISKFIYEHQFDLTPNDRRLLQEALSLVTNESQWVRKDMQLTVIGTLVHVVFYSGDRRNKYVVHLNDNKPTYVVEERGWLLKLRDGLKTCWGWFKKATQLAIGWL